MNNEEHLPMFGVGPYLVGTIAVITIFSIIASFYKIIPVYNLIQLNIVFEVLGILSIIFGVGLWLSAVVNSRVGDNIKKNNLVTTGVYAYVAHPIYACFLFLAIGLILISNNILLFILPILFWVLFTIVLIKTEEKWLIDKYGDEYIKYLKKVNRFIPFKILSF